ncbi:acetyltransferase [Paraburkholderia azotifigens]|uniref:acetyltransferase n=1 Tax=Paraburkholderia azotifigens TaxID=2057004 RepID=UPI0038B766DF
MTRYAIYGCGGHGREVLPIVRDILRDRHDTNAVVFVSDVGEEVGTFVNGVEVIAFDKLISAGHRDRKVILSLGTSAGRRKLAEKCEAEQLEFESIAASSHKRFDDVTVGEGAVFSEFTMATANVRIGRHFQCNMYSYVAHDGVIGDFVTFAPRVNCNGRIVIEDDVYVGSGAVLRNGNPDRPLRIGRGAIVGMGAIVTKDVEPFTTVVGNPARPMIKA